MIRSHRLYTCLIVSCLIFLTAGCGIVRETLPDRSAMEQMLISTAADRAIDTLPNDWIAEKAVFIEASNLECYDKPYVLQRIRQAVYLQGGSIPEYAEDADIILEVASGGLSINTRNYLFGIPSLPVPIPFGGETLKTPELALFKMLFYKGNAKLILSAVDNATQQQICEIPTCYGQATTTFWWLLLFGPFERSDLPVKH